jgi:hypothetical protein
MSTSLSAAFAYEFESQVLHLGQQMVSRCLNTVRVKRDPAAVYHFERLTNVAMTAKTTGGAPQATLVSGVTHDKRAALVSPFAWGEHMAQNEGAQALIDPRSVYVEAASAAYGRRIDQTILSAAVAAAAFGFGGTGGTTALPAGQKIKAGAGAALTLDDLRLAKRKMDAAEVMGERYFALPSVGLENLLKITEVASADYNTVRALVQGELDTFLGFKFIRTELVPFNGANPLCVAYTSKAIGLGLPQDGFTRVAEDPANSFALRVYLETTLGAVRIEDAGVVSVEILP